MYNVMTLMKLSREHTGDELLVAALDGNLQTVDSVSDLYAFVVERFGRDTESDVSKKYWQCCATYLVNQGVTKEQLQKLRRPHPRYGEPGFRSIFDEMLSEGQISKEDYAQIYDRSIFTL